MMTYNQQSEFMELLHGLLSIVEVKHFRYGLMGSSIIVRADIGPHCADPNCNEHLTLSLFIGSEPSNSTASPHCSLSGLITGIVERFKLPVKGEMDWENWNSLNLSFARSQGSLHNEEDTGQTGPTEFPLDVGEDGRRWIDRQEQTPSGEQ